MRINELLNKRSDKALWSMAPCEICDAPTRWVLSPYCNHCCWLVAYWRDGVVDHEDIMGDMPPPEALNGDSALRDDRLLPWFNSRGLYVDTADRTRLRHWSERTASFKDDLKKKTDQVVHAESHWSSIDVARFQWNEQNQLERVSALEHSINEKD